MPRQRLSESLKNARYYKAKKQAARLNNRLPKPYCYAYATQWGKVYNYYCPAPGVRVRLHSNYDSPEFHAELSAIKRGEVCPKTEPRQSKRPPSPPPDASWPKGTFGWLVQDRYMRDDEQWSTYVDQDRRKRDLLACLRTKINPKATDQKVFGRLPLEFVGVNTVQTLMKVKLEQRMVADTMEPKSRLFNRVVS